MPDDATGGWFKVPRELLRGNHLAAMSGAEIKVYLAIRNAEGDNAAHPGLTKLSKVTGLSRRHAIRALSALTAAGYITQERRGTVHKDASEYRSEDGRLVTPPPGDWCNNVTSDKREPVTSDKREPRRDRHIETNSHTAPARTHEDALANLLEAIRNSVVPLFKRYPPADRERIGAYWATVLPGLGAKIDQVKPDHIRRVMSSWEAYSITDVFGALGNHTAALEGGTLISQAVTHSRRLLSGELTFYRGGGEVRRAERRDTTVSDILPRVVNG